MLTFPNPQLPKLHSLGLIGTGKLGGLILDVAQKKGISLVIVNRSSAAQQWEEMAKTQVWIDVSFHEGIEDRLEKARHLNIPFVIGTTGIESLLKKWESHPFDTEHGVLISANFNPMVSLFYHMCESLYQKTEALGSFKAHIKESHRVHKKDSPSGTALELYSRLQKLGMNHDCIESIREGDIKGIHSLELTGPWDKWTIKHETLSRESFAYGALLAAQWMLNRPGLYHFQDVIKDLTPFKL